MTRTRIAVAFFGLIGAASFALAQVPPPVNSTPTATTVSVPVALAPFSAPISTTATPSTFSTMQQEQVCCGVAATAFPAALAGRTSVIITNLGPNTAYVGASGVSATTGIPLALGSPSNPGGSVVLNPASDFGLFCISSVLQVTPNCMNVQETL